MLVQTGLCHCKTSVTNATATFSMCVHVVILPLLHVSTTRPCYISTMCEQHMILLTQYVIATCSVVCMSYKARPHRNMCHKNCSLFKVAPNSLTTRSKHVKNHVKPVSFNAIFIWFSQYFTHISHAYFTCMWNIKVRELRALYPCIRSVGRLGSKLGLKVDLWQGFGHVRLAKG